MYRLYVQPMPQALMVAVKRAGVLVDVKLFAEGNSVQLGQVRIARVNKVAAGIEGCFLDLGDGEVGFLNASDAQLEPGQTLKQGQPYLVQIKRLAEGDKQHLVSAQLKRTGFEVVLLANEPGLRFSKRFQGDRAELKAAFTAAGLLDGADGWIIRSSAGSVESVLAEARSLLQQADDWRQAMDQSSKSRLLWCDHPVLSMLKAYASEAVEAVYVECGALYEELHTMLREQQPAWLTRLHAPQVRTSSLFDVYDIQSGLERALQQRVWLKSGAYLDFFQTPAMVTVDVNTGKNQKAKAVMKANHEACVAIAQQLRLRGWGGLVAIDFANTQQKGDRAALDKALRKAFADDPEPVQFQPTNAFFVAMLSRRRSGAAWTAYFTEACPYCKVTPRFSPSWTLFQIHLRLYSHRDSGERVELTISSRLESHLRDHQPDWLKSAERLHGLGINVEVDPEQRASHLFDIMPVDEEEGS